MNSNVLLATAFATVLALSGFSCMNSAAAPKNPQQALLAEVTGSEVRDFWTNDFGREKRQGGYSALVPEDEAEQMLLAVRRRLPTGYVAFVGTTRNLDDPGIKGVEVVIAPGHDQFDILHLAATDGINYGLDTDRIVTRLKAWDSQFGIDTWQAETDTVQMKIKSLPSDMDGFSERLYAFCPDIVDQGTGDLESLQRAIASDRAIFLWWD